MAWIRGLWGQTYSFFSGMSEGEDQGLSEIDGQKVIKLVQDRGRRSEKLDGESEGGGRGS